MSKYRILKVTYADGSERYYAQKKVLWFWMYIIGKGLFFNPADLSFTYPEGENGLQIAQQEILRRKRANDKGVKSIINV